MEITFRKAHVQDLDRCAEIRGLTRDNPLDRATLIALGVTEEAWSPKLEQGMYEGWVAEDKGTVVGFCFGDRQTGEVLVLALLAPYEGIGIGRHLLSLLMDRLHAAGHATLWLAASPDPHIRAHGFYRHLGWQPTHTYDDHGDEILTYTMT